MRQKLCDGSSRRRLVLPHKSWVHVDRRSVDRRRWPKSSPARALVRSWAPGHPVHGESPVWSDVSQRLGAQTDLRRLRPSLEAWAKSDFAAEVRGNPTPVQVIVGEHDPALSAALMEQTWLQFYPQARLEVLANCGHYPMSETPVALATSIESFLGS